MTVQKHDFTLNVQFQHDLAPGIIQILRKYTGLWVNYRLSTQPEDTQYATDLVLQGTSFGHGAISVAARLRKASYYKRYRDMTIRSQSKGGGVTELAKLRDKDGVADIYFYGWQADDAGGIAEWVIANVATMRSAGLFTKQRKPRSNGDGTAFVSISIHELLHCGAVMACRLDAGAFAPGYFKPTGLMMSSTNEAPMSVVALPDHLEKAA